MWGMGAEILEAPPSSFQKEKPSIQISGKAVNTRSPDSTERTAARPEAPGTSPEARA